MVCACLSLFASWTALVDSGFCAGVGAGVGLWLDLVAVTGASTLGGGAGVVKTSKMVASYFIASICSVPREVKGDDGEELRRATVSSRAAAVAASTDDVAGMGVACGKNSADREILSERVLGI